MASIADVTSGSPAASLRRHALALGFDAVGVTAAALPDETRARFAAFLAAGRQGDMGWMAANADRRGDPQVLWPAARSVVMLAVNHAPPGDPLALLEDKGRATIASYALRRDYHDVIKARLKVLARWMVETLGGEVKVFVDTAPVMEKPLAQAAGLGWQGKHTNLVSRAFGSWLFLGAIYTTLALEPAEPHDDHCGACTRCLDICPTRAFPAPYQLDARRCIAYLTIEHKGHIDAGFRPAIGNRVFGCDDCLAACPWNKFAQAAHDQQLAMRQELARLPLASLLALDDAGFRTLFRGTPIKRTGRERILRNGLIAAGNAGEAALIPAVMPHLDEPSPILRAMAVWALARLLDRGAFDALRAVRSMRESDSSVLEEWGRPDQTR